MINSNKCPKCDRVITKVQVEDVTIQVGFTQNWKGFSYGCPSCRAVLGVQMNPLTLNDDLKIEILKALRS